MFGWNIHETSSNSTSTNTQACVFLNVMSMSYMVYFNFFGCILPPLLIITALYGYIFIAIHKQLREGAVSGSESVSYYRKERSLAGSLALVVVLYAFCWFPLHLMHVASFFWLVPVPSGAIDVGTLLSHTNSAVNPVVYAFKIEKLRAAYKIIWRRFILCCVEKCPTKDTHTTENCITDISTAKSVTSSGPVRPA
uniref:G-protein coupled receptors family 1 profile domain-containing protein n=1 Tax=Denticeps clupeoides TaxID=299321 RepID=A0AAY4EVM0_9TELE